MGNKSSRARSSTAGPRAAAPPPPPSGVQQRPTPSQQQNQQQQQGGSTAALVLAAVSTHRPRSATAATAAAVPEPVVYTEASFVKFPATHRPSGRVYPLKSCRWPPELLASMVSSKAIAPFAPGLDDPASPSGQQLEECPLCMLYYSTGLNNCLTCHQGMCSECFASLQDAPASRATSACGSKCPFCNVAPFKSVYTGPKSIEDLRKLRDEADEMKRLERVQLDAAIADETARLERKRQGLPPLTPPMQPAAPAAVASPLPQSAVASPSPQRSTSESPQPASAARGERNPDLDLFHLPSEIRLAIEQEEFRQRLTTYYRHRRPDGLPNVDEIVRRYGVDKQDSVLAAAVAKYGPMPPVEEIQRDTVARLLAFYKSKKGNMTHAEATATVATFGGAPWKAIARAIVERGRETQPAPLPAGVTNVSSPTTQTPGTAGSPAAASPTTAAVETTLSKHPAEVVRQTIITLLRIRRPSLLDFVRGIFAANPNTRLTDMHVCVVAAECGVRSMDVVDGEVRADIALRLRHYFAIILPQRPGSDVESLLTKYAGREAALMAGIVLKYGAEPVNAPLLEGPASLPLERADDATVKPMLSSMLVTDDLDADLAIALRCSVESL